MSNRAAPESIALSYLNAIEYCPRRFYYEFVQGDTYRSLKFQADITNHRPAEDRQQERSPRGSKSAAEEEKEA